MRMTPRANTASGGTLCRCVTESIHARPGETAWTHARGEIHAEKVGAVSDSLAAEFPAPGTW